MKCTCLDIEKMDIKTLQKERGKLLEEIHEKQQTLDQMDYQIYKKRMKKGQGIRDKARLPASS